MIHITTDETFHIFVITRLLSTVLSKTASKKNEKKMKHTCKLLHKSHVQLYFLCVRYTGHSGREFRSDIEVKID